MTSHFLTPLLAPRSIAVVGASMREGFPGNTIIHEIRRGGFAGALYAVNPNYDEIEGIACHAAIDDLPEAVDLAVLIVANHRLEAQLVAAIEAGTRAAVIYSSGALEGDGGLLDRLRGLASEAGMAICGGNGMGFYNFDAYGADGGAWLCPFAVQNDSGPGPIAMITHSGSAFTSLLNLGARLQYNLAVSSGQEYTASLADFLDYALDMPSTRVVMLFIETLRDPEGFRAALEKARARDIPIVALKVGRTEASAKFALSHSGALVGSDHAFQALCDHYGVIRVYDLDELIATTSLLALPNRVHAGGLAALTDSGGEREMLVDLADDLGVPFADIGDDTRAALAEHLDYGLDPVNPCDAWGTMDHFEDTFAGCLEALIGDADSAMGLLLADTVEGRLLSYSYGVICRAQVKRTGKPVVIASWVSRPRYGDMAEKLIADGVLVLDGVTLALKAVKHAFAYRDFRARPAAALLETPDADLVGRWRARLARGDVLDEAEGLALLADFGIPCAAVSIVESRDEAFRAAGETGYPVALKTAMAGIVHKSDVGGVKLGLADGDAVAAAYDDLSARLGPRALIAPMVAPGIELALGVTIDAQVGPLVMVGAGGVLVELLADTRTALPPLDSAAARRLIDGLALRPMLDGHRGAPAVDMDVLAETVARFSLLAHALGDCIAEFDVNPLIVGPDGCIAVDALVVGRAPD